MLSLATAAIGCAKPLSPTRELQLLRKFCEARGDEPSRCSHVRSPTWAEQALLNSSASHSRFQALLAQRPGSTKEYCGMVINHVYALFVTLEALQPPIVIESGVLAGQGTWLIRQVVPHARIFSLDPAPNLIWHDPSPLTSYHVDANFTDFGALDWRALVPSRAQRVSGLVVLDDHMSSVRRTAEAIDAGFGHIFYEDNWKYLGQGQRSPLASDCYSFSTLCSSPLPLARPLGAESGAGSLLYQDHFGRTQLHISPQEHEANLAFVLGHVAAYVELPALFDACLHLPHPAGGPQRPTASLFTVGSKPRGSRSRPSLLSYSQALQLFGGLSGGRLNLISWSSYYPPYLRLKHRLNTTLLRRTTPYLRGIFRPKHRGCDQEVTGGASC